MKIPKYIDVLGQRFKIKHKDLTLTGSCGQFHAEKREIWICKSLQESPEEQWRCFLHEAFHSLCYRNGIFCTSLHPEIEEILVETSASFIYELYTKLGVEHG